MKNTIILSTVFAAIAAVAVVACGSSSSSSGTGSTGTCNPSGNSDPTCNDCVSANCGDEFSTAESACADLLDCESGCGCTQSCAQSCSSKVTADCQSAGLAIYSCQMQKCANECASNTTSSSSGSTTASTGSGGGTCADLALCCPQVTDMSAKQACDQTVSAGNDSNCGTVLSSYKAANYCQ